jgi:drug/metabolite transporter (DMT)-like permease
MSSATAAAGSAVRPRSTIGRARLGPAFAGLLWAAVSVVIFAGWFVVTRFSVTHELRIWDILALRFGVGALLLLPVLLAPGRRLRPRAWLHGLLLALLWGAPFVLLVAQGLELTSAAEASSVTPALMPVFAGLIGWLGQGEQPVRRRILGYAAIMAGLVALLASGSPAGERPSLQGLALLVIAAGMWALYTLRFRSSGLTSLQAAALISIWSAVLYLPFYLGLGLSRLGDAPAREVLFQTAYQGCLMSAVAIVTYNRAVAVLGPGAAAAIIALVPVAATTMAAPLLGEVPSPIQGLAVAVIAVGVILAARPALPRRSSGIGRLGLTPDDNGKRA